MSEIIAARVMIMANLYSYGILQGFIENASRKYLFSRNCSIPALFCFTSIHLRLLNPKLSPKPTLLPFWPGRISPPAQSRSDTLGDSHIYFTVMLFPTQTTFSRCKIMIYNHVRHRKATGRPLGLSRIFSSGIHRAWILAFILDNKDKKTASALCLQSCFVTHFVTHLRVLSETPWYHRIFRDSCGTIRCPVDFFEVPQSLVSQGFPRK